MSMHGIYVELHQVLDVIEERMHQATPDEMAVILDDLNALLDYHESILENWLYFDDRLKRLQDTSLHGSPFSGDQGDTEKWNTVLPMGTLEVISSEWDNHHLGMNEQFRKGLGFFDLQMFRDSAREFKELLHDQPNLQLVRLFYAISMMASGQFDKAETELNHLLNTSTDTAILTATWEAVAQLYVENRPYELARQALTRVLALRTNHPDAHINLAICSYTLGDYRQAANHAMLAAKLEPHDELAWRLAGAANHAMRHYEDALAAYEQALLNAPKHPFIRSETARVLTVLSRTSEASILYKELLQQQEWAADAYLGLAEIELMNAHYKEAIVYLKKRLSLIRHDAQSMLWLGFAFYGERDIQKANEIFQLLQKENPPISLLASTGLARIAADSEQIQQAKQHLKVLFAQHDKKWHAHGLAEYGYLYAKLHQPQLSILFFKKAITLDPRQIDAKSMLTQLLQMNG